MEFKKIDYVETFGDKLKSSKPLDQTTIELLEITINHINDYPHDNTPVIPSHLVKYVHNLPDVIIHLGKVYEVNREGEPLTIRMYRGCE